MTLTVFDIHSDQDLTPVKYCSIELVSLGKVRIHEETVLTPFNKRHDVWTCREVLHKGKKPNMPHFPKK